MPMNAPREDRLPGGRIDGEPLELSPHRWYWLADPEPADFRIDRSELTWLAPWRTAVGYGGWYLVVHDGDHNAVARSGPWPNDPETLADAVREMFPAQRESSREVLAALEEEGRQLIENALTARVVSMARELAGVKPPGEGTRSPAAVLDELQDAANARQAWLAGHDV